MSNDFYLPRTLLVNDRNIPEEKLLEECSVVVVLAEPGAGKTELLRSLARRLYVSLEKASIFRHRNSTASSDYLVLDALDEVAKLDPSAIDAIFVKAQESGAKLVIFSSRSSEWEKAREIRIRECFGTDPKVVRLLPFDENEQKALFSYHMPDEDFVAFKSELEKFDLEPLLGNPQFLRLFAEAFVESGRKFTTKKKLFEDAVRRLANVPTNGVAQKTGPTRGERIAWANEVFAKLLLSGAVGVDITDTLEEIQFPRLTSLVQGDPNVANILDTQLFKPSDDPNKHEPVHRIVAEFCAARYLAARVDDSSDAFSLRRCMAVIAPNSVVRDELRGLLGWMAAVGSQALQEATINLDPYAVLANGDPSQLSLSSKKRLLAGLQQVAADDPFFRRSDVWRTFSASGFFTGEVVDVLRPLLTGKEENGHLRGLLLELLEGSGAIPQLEPELRALMLDPDCSTNTRGLAHRCLISMPEHDHAADCKTLISEGGKDSLNIAAKLYQTFSVAKLGRGDLLDLLRQSANLYPGQKDRREREIGARYFVKQLVRTLDPKDVEWLLDQLTNGLQCTCDAKAEHDCDCRNGISKIVGSLLDRYFELRNGPYDPAKMWGWIGNLNFHGQMSAEQSAAVHLLQTDHQLRQSIQRLVLGHLTDPQVVWDTRFNSFEFQSHSGLHFQSDDWKAMAEYAFETDNPGLWSSFIAAHNPHRNADERGPDDLRRNMREQAREKPTFMRVWAQKNRAWEASNYEWRERHYRSVSRRKRRERVIAEKNAAHFREERDLIEGGEHWGWLSRFGDYYLIQPNKLPEIVEEASIAENALRNCFGFLKPHVPSLEQLALGNWWHVARVLYAACLVVFRDVGHLGEIDRAVLQAVKTDQGGYKGVGKEEVRKFEEEINRRIFSTPEDIESFLRAYVEPQLERGPEAQHTDAGWLQYKEEFAPLRDLLPFEWLLRFPILSLSTMSTLFDLSANYSDRTELQKLIIQRCDEFLTSWPEKSDDEDLEKRRKFWFLRHFFFIDDVSDVMWAWLRSDSDMIFAFESIAGSSNRGDNAGWPNLVTAKIYCILDAFVEKWPKVDLPNSFGSSSPNEERAYRFLTDVIWQFGNDDPGRSLPVLDRILSDSRFGDFHMIAQNLRATAIRKLALRDFAPPTPAEVVGLLDQNAVATVEGLRALLLEELRDLQQAINGSEFDPIEIFYNDGKRVDENTASKRIAERLQLRLTALNMAVTIEHQLKDARRCDITATAMLGGSRKLLVIEVKGQWHRELFTAAAAQLHERYSIHPDAEQQGIYLVLWFGGGEKVAGKTDSSISGPDELYLKVIASVPEELRGLTDVFVLDLSRN